MAPHPLELPRPCVEAAVARAPRDDARLAEMVQRHYDFVWRSLRRLGVPERFVDDAAQHVWLVVARRLDDVAPDRERSFLFGTAMRVASEARRARSRRPEILGASLEPPADDVPTPEQTLEERRSRACLDAVLDAMSMPTRTVFVLFELEEMPAADIAALLEIPVGTVASRLRRAREEFHEIVRRLRARGVIPGGDHE